MVGKEALEGEMADLEEAREVQDARRIDLRQRDGLAVDEAIAHDGSRPVEWVSTGSPATSRTASATCRASQSMLRVPKFSAV